MSLIFTSNLKKKKNCADENIFCWNMNERDSYLCGWHWSVQVHHWLHAQVSIYLENSDNVKYNQNVLSFPLYSFLPAQPTPTSKFLQGYFGAVTSAVSLAVSMFVIQQHQRVLFQLHSIFIVTFSEKGAEVVHLKCCVSFFGLHAETRRLSQ